MRAVFPVFPGAEELDLAGPWEALTLARQYGEADAVRIVSEFFARAEGAG